MHPHRTMVPPPAVAELPPNNTNNNASSNDYVIKEPFFKYCARVIIALHPNLDVISLIFLAKVVTDQVVNWGSDDPFKGVCDATKTNVILPFNEAFENSLADIANMTLFMGAYVGTQILTLLLSKVLAATLVSLAPFYYFPPLLAKAPNFNVIVCTYKVPLFWFQFMWALVFSIHQGLVILVVLFISWVKLPPIHHEVQGIDDGSLI